MKFLLVIAKITTDSDTNDETIVDSIDDIPWTFEETTQLYNNCITKEFKCANSHCHDNNSYELYKGNARDTRNKRNSNKIHNKRKTYHIDKSKSIIS